MVKGLGFRVWGTEEEPTLIVARRVRRHRASGMPGITYNSGFRVSSFGFMVYGIEIRV
jgi:hypothetical protein